jgi:hypothetical protein
MFRAPGGIGPELATPPGADEQTRYLAFLGRRAEPRSTEARPNRPAANRLGAGDTGLR